ncbi:MAG: amidase [Gammaproteobacteria bacterium]|nr:MAG: amidase [Gammaproteobacteria bacterium]UCH39678.1 MAG: amidase [Gammaproteobacteria bacterium]
MNSEPVFATITDLTAALRNGEISATQLIRLYRDRIEMLAAASKAFISLDLERAADRAEEIDAGSDADLPLAGIPYACKDLFDVAGTATTGGSNVLSDNIARRDADSISRMNASGAIFIGKNNLHEFAYGATGENQIYGTPPNPYDPARLTGGSSSGSAAALAYGLCAMALGTDTGGSVRAPAALCGLVGFKPTFGRISTDGVIPYSWSLDHVGTLTRSAADAAILFEILASHHQPAALPGLERLTIGIPRTFFFEHCDSEILESLERLKTFLQNAGARLIPVEMPSMEYTRTVSLTVQMPEALSYHNRYLEQRGELYSADFRAGLALGQCLLAEQYIRAKRFIESYRRDLDQVFAAVDLILTPATPVIAPPIGAVEVSVEGLTEPAGNAITRYTSFFNMTGHPAITLPCGMHSAGLPIAAQLIGRHHADEILIESTRLIEQNYDFQLPLPPRL